MFRLLFSPALLLCFSPLVHGQSAPRFKSLEVRTAQKQCDAKLKSLNEKYLAAQRRLAETYMKEARAIKQEMLDVLEDARTKATKADDLDEALKLRDAHEQLTEKVLTPPEEAATPGGGDEKGRRELEAFLPGTRWAFEGKDEIVYGNGVYWKPARPQRGPRWRAVSGNTVEVTYPEGHGSIQTFNDARTHFLKVTPDGAAAYAKLVGRVRK